MNSISNLLNESSEMQTQRSKAVQLVRKWEKTGLLEGLDKEYEKSGIATLLENQALQLIREASQTGTAEGSEEWAGVALPLVRRVFAEIAAKDFVSVQPMNLPSGLVFYLDFKYGTAQAGFTVDTDKDSQAGTIHGVTETAGDPSDGLYGAGRFGYSINDTTSAALTPAAAISATAFASGSVAASDYNFDTRWSASYAGNFGATTSGIVTLTVSASSLVDGDETGVRAFSVSGSGINTYFPEYTRLSSNAQSVVFVVSGSASAIVNAVIGYQKTPGVNLTSGPDGNRLVTDRGDFEWAGTDLDIPEINVQLRSEVISAKTRKLKAIWTPEFSQDLNAYHAIDAEAELTSMLSEYISQEIDLEILDMLRGGALTTDYWSAKTGYTWNGGSFSSAGDPAAFASAYNQGEWFQTLGTKIQKVSNKIHQKTMRGGANFIVVSPDVATVLESIPGYAASTNGDQMDFSLGIQKVGMLNNRFTVYKNPYFTTNTILLGYRGSQFLETGAVYAPYIPLIMTPLIYDPTNFVPRKGVMTRYAKKLVRPEFYGIIHCADLNVV
jgi:hypothetical protein